MKAAPSVLLKLMVGLKGVRSVGVTSSHSRRLFDYSVNHDISDDVQWYWKDMH